MEKKYEVLKSKMEVIAGEWDGDNSGRLEDKAHIAENIIDKIDLITILEKKIIKLQNELDEL